ncbi:MAG: GIY-YIG nuclease family protein [Verrucomicrobia bacterium]|nr:GIY-YIG nuclease family protein [Cytophagales bacterium]
MWNYNFYVYLLSNQSNSVLYIGMTNNLLRRVQEHKSKITDGFTKRYNVDKLVYFEHFSQVEEAIAREKQIKGWSRNKKELLMKEINPTWDDLFELSNEQ